MSQPKKVLVVEDDEGISFIVREVLRADGYDVKHAYNGLEALEILRKEGIPDLILLDMKMPVMDGWHFAAEFMARHDHMAPIVVMTAAGNAVKRAQDIQAAACLGKPFDIHELQRVVKRFVEPAVAG